MNRAKLILLILILLLTLPELPLPFQKEVVQPVHAAAVSITLYAALSGWNDSKPSGPNPTITINEGDTVSFNLVGEDSYPHLLVLDFDGDMVTCAGSQDKCSGNIAQNGGTSSIAPFTVTAPAGNYWYYCLYHSPGAMVGKLVVQGPDYRVSSNPASLSINQGTNANSTIFVSSLGNFAGSVMLTATPPSSWPSPLFSVDPVVVSAGMTSTSRLTIYVPLGVAPGPYMVSVMASNSTSSHSTAVSVTVPVPDFSITTNPSSLTINSGTTGMSTISITGSNGFSGTVSLTTSAPLGRGIATLSSTSVALSSTRTSAVSMLNITNSLGTFNVTLTGTSSGISHSTRVLITGPDFTITTSSTILNVNQGSSATFTITLSSVNEFSGTVSLQAIPSNGGPAVSISPTSLQVPAAGSVSSTVTVMASSTGTYSTPISPGSYTISLNATMGSLSHVVSIPLMVTSPSFGAGLLTSPLLIGGIIGAVVILGVAIYVLTRRTRNSKVQ